MAGLNKYQFYFKLTKIKGGLVNTFRINFVDAYSTYLSEHLQ